MKEAKAINMQCVTNDAATADNNVTLQGLARARFEIIGTGMIWGPFSCKAMTRRKFVMQNLFLFSKISLQYESQIS